MFMGHEWRLRLTNASVRFAEAIILCIKFCLFQFRSLVMHTTR